MEKGHPFADRNKIWPVPKQMVFCYEESSRADMSGPEPVKACLFCAAQMLLEERVK